MTDDMKVLLIGIVSIIILLFLVFGLIAFKTDWKKIDEQNKKFLDKNGDHIIYERGVIEEKKKEKGNNN